MFKCLILDVSQVETVTILDDKYLRTHKSNPENYCLLLWT